MGHHGGRPTAAATMLAAAAAALALLAGTARAAFVNAFGGVVHGAPLRLEWEAVDAGFYPLTLTARLINRTEGNRANGVVLNLTNQITTGSQWLWENVPWPLPHLHGALYEVQVRPSTGNPSVLARSGYFGIKDENPSQPRPGQLVTDHDGGPREPNRTLALGIGVSLGIATAIALIVAAIVLRRRRRRRVTEEKRRRRRLELNIH